MSLVSILMTSLLCPFALFWFTPFCHTSAKWFWGLQKSYPLPTAIQDYLWLGVHIFIQFLHLAIFLSIDVTFGSLWLLRFRSAISIFWCNPSINFHWMDENNFGFLVANFSINCNTEGSIVFDPITKLFLWISYSPACMWWKCFARYSLCL